MDREGKAYKHRLSGALIAVVRSKPMSSGTTRHTVLILDEGGEAKAGRRAGDQVEIDEVPVQRWLATWEDV